MKMTKMTTLIALFTFLLLKVSIGEAALQKGALAPSFPALDSEEKAQMAILYFFKHSSKSSIKGLEHLKTQHLEYQNSGIEIYAISQSASKELNEYLKMSPLPFTVIKEGGKIFKDYGVQIILPTTYVLSAGGRVSDILEGGGPTSNQFMTTVAQRSLQLKKPALAKKLYVKALEKMPDDLSTQAGLGHALLVEGEFDQAEAVFTKVAHQSSPDAVLGQEGLAAVHLKKGENDKALAIAEEINKADPENGLVYLIKGNILAGQGDQDGALASYDQAIEGKLSQDWQEAEVFNQAGRIHSEQGQYKQAEAMYLQAYNNNPFSSEILTNRGALYEKQGKAQAALAFYEEALLTDPKDDVAVLLAKRVMQNLAFKEDLERQKRVDTLVSELSERFKKGSVASTEVSDSWSSRPMTLAFLGLKSLGGGLLREGMLEVFQQEIAQNLMASGRVSVVEREIMEKLLLELKLGSSELADQETALKLGKLLAARLIVTGSLVQTRGGARLSLRLIDPETSAIKITYSGEIGPDKNLIALGDETGSGIQKRIQSLYPLRGKIALVEEDGQVIINLGKKHGILPGTEMKIISEGEAIMMDGKIIGHRKKKVGLLEIVEVEDRLSYGKLIEKTANIEKDQKVLESAKK